MKTLTAIVLLLLALPALGKSKPDCPPLEKGFRVYGPELNLAQVETLGRKFAAENSAAPQIPFAYGHQDWLNLKALYRAGDVFRQYDGPRWSDGSPIAGGYILLRGKCVVGLLGTWRT